MIINGHLNFFSIDECGLYKNGSADCFGIDLKETFELLSKWVKENDFEATLPWKKDKRSDGALCYCHDIHHDTTTDDYVLVLWKSGPNSNGKILGADPSASVGRGKVIEYGRKFKKPVIWGSPCYYWIIPSLKIVASIKFDHSICDKDLFQDWVATAITSRVKHKNKSKTHTNEKYVRIQFTDKTQDNEIKFRYSFKTSLKILQTESTKLDDLQKIITHIVKRETIELKHDDEREKWLTFFDGIMGQKSNGVTTRQIEITAEASPSVEEIKELLDKHGKIDRVNGAWDRVGFDTTSGKVWLDSYRMTSTVAHNKTSAVISAAELFESLNKHRKTHLKPETNHVTDAEIKKSVGQ